MKKKSVFAFVLCVLLAGCSVNKPQPEISIVPQPLEMIAQNGEFHLKKQVVIGISDDRLQAAADYLKDKIVKATGSEVKTGKGNGDIMLLLADTVLGGKEGAYRLCVDKDRITLVGNDYGSIISGIGSIRQLMPVEFEREAALNRQVKWAVPAVQIADAPRFGWRGMMLDVARHFYTKEEVMQLLDLMAMYKLNKFHWHLTDDQGWRVEIKKYPLLTEKGAWRKYNSHDRSCLNMARKQDNPDFLLPDDRKKVIDGDTVYGGFYTQDDIREVVAYAARLGIDIMPEIDMPGHFLAAASNYKGIACHEQTGWGTTFSSPICPGKESAMEFCKNVYSEIFQLFPYKYVHLGADEVEKTNWKKCRDCQRRIKEKGLKNEEELQAWFVKDMEKFFNANGKELFGWDEILEGGLSETAHVMWWRSWAKKSVPLATAQGNQVVMCPNAIMYFDAQPDKNTLSSVYHFEPFLKGLSPEQQSLIMGVQANLWTEWIPSWERVEYLITPRMLALAEVAWTQPENKDWEAFQGKVIRQLPRLDIMGINYRIPDLVGGYTSNAFIGETTVSVECPAPLVKIYYTTDGSIPNENSILYTGPFTITETTDFTFRTFRPDGTKGDLLKMKYIKDSYSPAVQARPTGEGVKAVWHDYRGNSCKGIEDAPVKGEYVVNSISIPKEAKGDIGLVLTGFLDIPEDGIYTFALHSDDGSVLTIDDYVVVDNDGAHSPREIIGQKALAKGLHPFKVTYFDYNGGILEMNRIDGKGEKVPFPASWFKY